MRALITREILRSKGAQWYAILRNCRRAKKASDQRKSERAKTGRKREGAVFQCARALITREIMCSKDAQCNTEE